MSARVPSLFGVLLLLSTALADAGSGEAGSGDAGSGHAPSPPAAPPPLSPPGAGMDVVFVILLVAGLLALAFLLRAMYLSLACWWAVEEVKEEAKSGRVVVRVEGSREP